MRKIKIPKPEIPGGYITRNISKTFLSSTPIIAWTHTFHKPYADDWKEAKEKAIEHCRSSAIVYEGGKVDGRIATSNSNTKADNK
jgi:hypothetical protein